MAVSYFFRERQSEFLIWAAAVDSLIQRPEYILGLGFTLNGLPEHDPLLVPDNS